MILGLLPSIALSSPIGYFLAMLLVMDNGVWLALLFMLPLLLARYSFKLYLDGRRQQFSIIKAFAAALDAKDAYTQGHSSRVAAYTVQIATAMHLPERRVRRPGRRRCVPMTSERSAFPTPSCKSRAR